MSAVSAGTLPGTLLSTKYPNRPSIARRPLFTLGHARARVGSWEVIGGLEGVESWGFIEGGGRGWGVGMCKR